MIIKWEEEKQNEVLNEKKNLSSLVRHALADCWKTLQHKLKPNRICNFLCLFLFWLADEEPLWEHTLRGRKSDEEDEGESPWTQEHQPAPHGGIPVCPGEA